MLGPGPGPGGRIVVEAAQLGDSAAVRGGVAPRVFRRSRHAGATRTATAARRLTDAIRSALIAAGASADCDVDLAGFSPPLVPVGAVPRPVVSDLDYDEQSAASAPCCRWRAREWTRCTCAWMGVRMTRSCCRLPRHGWLPAASGRPNDVRTARVRTSLLRGDVMHNPSDSFGMQTKRMIAPGQPLFVNDLMRPSMVVKGATVLMVLDSPGIALTAQGQAIELGAIGRADPNISIRARTRRWKPR